MGRGKKACLERYCGIGSRDELANQNEPIVEPTDLPKQVPDTIPSPFLNHSVVS